MEPENASINLTASPPTSIPQDVTAFVKEKTKIAIAQLKEAKSPEIKNFYLLELVRLKNIDPETFGKILKARGLPPHLQKEFEILSKTREAGKTYLPGEMESKSKTEERDLTGTKLESHSTSEVAKTDTVAKGKQKVPDQFETPETPPMDLKDILMKLPRDLLVRMLDLEWTENLLTTLIEAKDSKFAVESHPKFAFYNALRCIEEGKTDQVESIIKI